MKNLFIPVYIFLALLSSCVNKDDKQNWEWEWNDEVENCEKSRFLWIDAAANFNDFANSKKNIFRDLKIAKESGFTSVVVDVRPTSGDVLFNTNNAEKVKWLGVWLPDGYTKVKRTASWDYLQAFIEAGKELELEIYAGVNLFVGGNITSLGSEGVLFRDTEKKEWATQNLTKSGIKSCLEIGGTGAKFFNPAREEVQDYCLDFLEDLASYKGLKGIILDRGRFDGLSSDFSDYTKKMFENFLGYSVQNFPDDIMKPETTTNNLPSVLPPLFKPWLEFRAKIIYDFMKKACERVKLINNKIHFGVYVGGWYSSYYSVGVNWASQRYNTAINYPKWASSNYNDYGYANLMDIIIIGAYAAPDQIYGTNEWTVQGFCSQAVNKIKNDAIVIGGPDVGNGAWATSNIDVTNRGIVNSVDAAINACDGYFLFDMIHLKKKNQWKYVKQGISQAIKNNN